MIQCQRCCSDTCLGQLVESVLALLFSQPLEANGRVRVRVVVLTIIALGGLHSYCQRCCSHVIIMVEVVCMVIVSVAVLTYD